MLDTLLRLDTDLFFWLQRVFYHPILDPIFVFITHLGDAGLIWFAWAIFFLVQKKYRKTGVLLLISLALTHLVSTIGIKNLVLRERPYVNLADVRNIIGPQSQYSFPSGHAASSFASAMVPFIREKRWLKYCPVILAALIAFSRIYLGVHYPLDVICGAIIGSLMAWLVCAVGARHGREGALRNRQLRSK